jgi:hypothetical protein
MEHHIGRGSPMDGAQHIARTITPLQLYRGTIAGAQTTFPPTSHPSRTVAINAPGIPPRAVDLQIMICLVMLR